MGPQQHGPVAVAVVVKVLLVLGVLAAAVLAA
jgi:hypothetical protein